MSLNTAMPRNQGCPLIDGTDFYLQLDAEVLPVAVIVPFIMFVRWLVVYVLVAFALKA